MGDQTTQLFGPKFLCTIIKRMSENYVKGAERDDMYR